MGQAVICDSCGNNVEPNGRSQVALSTPGYAGSVIDLCAECTTSLADLKVVKKAVRKVRRERREQVMANGGIPGPELEDPDDDADPMEPAVAPEVDAEPTEAVAT